MSDSWRDGERVRDVELRPLGEGRWRVTVDGAVLEVAAERLADGTLRLEADGRSHVVDVTVAGNRCDVHLGGADWVLERARAGRKSGARAQGGLEAPMPGTVSRVLVSPGDAVAQGQPLVAIEAMKMEHVIRAPRAGRVRRIAASVGSMVEGGVTLVELDADAEPGP